MVPPLVVAIGFECAVKPQNSRNYLVGGITLEVNGMQKIASGQVGSKDSQVVLGRGSSV